MGNKKTKVIFSCQNCGAQRPRWEGRCPECGAWNSFVEETISAAKPSAPSGGNGWLKGASVAFPLSKAELDSSPTARIETRMSELDRVLGGGFVPGSMILLGGAPGIGKSTLLLQIAQKLAEQGQSIFYVSAEESVQQTALRARRMGVQSDSIQLASTSALDEILRLTDEIKPQFLFVDSIQTIFTSEIESAPGSVSQVRECAARLLPLAKEKGVTVILVGHVTKEGNLAGPRVLEHMVDTVLSFDADPSMQLRLLRSVKNRFGPASELGIFEMQESGLIPVPHASEIFLRSREESLIGSAVFASLEGTRPVLCEVQALSIQTHFGNPRRTAVGLDTQRLHMLSAVLDRFLNMTLSQADIYVNVVGGLEIQDPSADLALAGALLSSLLNDPLPSTALFLGEIGLTGEIRSVQLPEVRMTEAARLGFTIFYLPLSQKTQLKNFAEKHRSLQFHWLKNVSQLRERFKGQELRPEKRPDGRGNHRPAGGQKIPARAPGPTTLTRENPDDLFES